MIRLRVSGRAPLGALPPASRCDDTVGRIQQAVNAAYAAKPRRISVVPGVLPISVDGRAGQRTKAAIDSALPNQNWEITSPQAVLRRIESSFGATPGAPFSCTGPRTGDDKPSDWGWVPWAVAGAVMVVGAVVLKGRGAAPAPTPPPVKRAAPAALPATP